MLKLNVRAKLKPEEILKKALGFFGPGGYGLKGNRTERYLCFL